MTSGVKAQCSDVSYGGYSKERRRCQYEESWLFHGTIDSTILGSLIRLERCEYWNYCQSKTIHSFHLASPGWPTFFFQEGSAPCRCINSSVRHEIVTCKTFGMMNSSNCTSYLLFTCSKCLRVRQRWSLSDSWSKRVQLWLKVERSQSLLTVRSRGIS